MEIKKSSLNDKPLITKETSVSAKGNIKNKVQAQISATARVQKTSQTQLFDMFLNLYPNANKELFPEIDQTQLRYVIYIRKSTDEDDKQVRSPQQQIDECTRELQVKGIPFDPKKDILIESASAKISGNRPIFDNMLKLIRQGKYDGIVAWHPDRLARNMKEAGEIIDMLDKHEIKDLIFRSAQFENTPSGKMLLGLLFVMAKEYSDKLSVDSTRGIGDVIELGKHFIPKHGYYLDKDRHLRPLTRSFELLREAFNMKLRGENHKTIIKYLNQNQYMVEKLVKDKATKVTTSKVVPFKMNDSTLSRIFRDPIYAGILKFGSKRELIVNLKDQYDFYPLITTDDYLKINPKVKNKYMFKTRATNYGKNTFLKDKVHCVCGSVTYHDRSTKASRYMRCKNPKCRAKRNTNIRLVIFKAVVDYLKSLTQTQIEGDFFPKYQANYERRVKIEEDILSKNLDNIRGEKRSMIGKIERFKKDAEETKDLTTLEFCAQKTKELENKLVALEVQEKDIKQNQLSLQKAPITLKEFGELFTDLPNWIEKEKDIDKIGLVVGKTFANFVVDGKKVLSCELNQDFDFMLNSLNSDDLLNGDPTENRTPITRLKI